MPSLASTQYRSQGAASYSIVDQHGVVQRRVVVGDSRGYSGSQYRDGYDVAHRMATNASNRSGQPYSVVFDSPWVKSPSVQAQTPRVAAYEIVDRNGVVQRRLLVGDTKGYSGAQYADGFEAAKRMADAASSRTGQPYEVRFSPWARR